MNELALFAGAGGGILGGTLLGWRTVCAVEIEPYSASVLIARQNEGILQPFPVWDDICTFDGKTWRGIVDVVSGGFPCQDISVAGKGIGITGERSGLWKEMARIIGEVRPKYAFIENSPMLVIRGLDRVLCDLASMGYNARWGIISAADTGAPHLRERIWIMAYDPNSIKENIDIKRKGTKVSYTDSAGFKEQCKSISKEQKHTTVKFSSWWITEPDVGRVAHGVVARADRLKAIGNGQVPAVVRLAWEILSEGIT